MSTRQTKRNLQKMRAIPAILRVGLFAVFLVTGACMPDKNPTLESYNIAWDTPSENSSESMPCGGGDIGLNVWVENGDILFYIARSGTFDENNSLLKLGRVRMRFSPNPFEGTGFRQELLLEKGQIQISGSDNSLVANLKIWVDIHRPVIHAEMDCNKKIQAEVIYENWRDKDFLMRNRESLENSYKWAAPDSLYKRADNIDFTPEGVQFYHRNQSTTIFDVTVRQQGLDTIKHLMYNPLHNLTFGGLLRGSNLEPAGTLKGKYQDTEFTGWKLESKLEAREHNIEIFLHTEQASNQEEWHKGLLETINDAENSGKKAYRETIEWWERYWERSYIFIGTDDPDPSSKSWQVGRNYQLFRYMLACNAKGKWPTKFNGGLFTFDPVYTREEWDFSPDFRNWGGGTFTAQNQRLVYFPMLKSGDFAMMRPQFDFYLRNLGNAEIRSRIYWGHEGACFTEQIENFGLPNSAEYGWERPEGMDPGMQNNAWLEYQWDTSLEICLMILQMNKYKGRDISNYLPLIESCLTFFDEHYRFLARQRGDPELIDGKLVLYPGSACETYKATLNATPTVAGLQQVLMSLLELPEGKLDPDNREHWNKMLQTIPTIPLREIEGRKVISPAETWERIQNTEAPQLYPVFPWRIYGLDKPGLETAINTWKFDPDVLRFRDHISWKQYGIFAACLGLSEEAAEETIKKLQNSERRFPAFWGPGFDWVPDHNWGGSGMIGLQDMLMQVNGDEIMLFPAWPSGLGCSFQIACPREHDC